MTKIYIKHIRTSSPVRDFYGKQNTMSKTNFKHDEFFRDFGPPSSPE